MKRSLAPEALYHSGHYDDHHPDGSGFSCHIPSSAFNTATKRTMTVETSDRALALLREIEQQRGGQ